MLPMRVLVAENDFIMPLPSNDRVLSGVEGRAIQTHRQTHKQQGDLISLIFSSK
jgi:hypothetical protein